MRRSNLTRGTAVLVMIATVYAPMKFGRRLFDSYAGPKDLKVFSQARHDDVTGQPAGWWKDTFDFWEKNGQR
jgi:hypothetical protein